MIGPKCTGCFLFLSIWGVIFLSILGGLYYNESVGLLEDLPDESNGWGHRDWSTERVKEIKKQYQQNAYNAWVAAGAYGALALVLSFRACCLVRR